MNTHTPLQNWRQLPSIWDIADEIAWLVDGLIPQGGFTILSADSGTGKSWLAYAIAGAVSQGIPLIGKKTTQRPVLYVDGENPAAIVKRNLTDLAIPRTDQLQVWGRWVRDDPPGTAEHLLVTNFASREQGLIIYDSLIEFHDGDEQDASSTRQFMKQFRVLTSLGATVLLLCHTGKSDKSRASAKNHFRVAHWEATV